MWAQKLVCINYFSIFVQNSGSYEDYHTREDQLEGE